MKSSCVYEVMRSLLLSRNLIMLMTFTHLMFGTKTVVLCASVMLPRDSNEHKSFTSPPHSSTSASQASLLGETRRNLSAFQKTPSVDSSSELVSPSVSDVTEANVENKHRVKHSDFTTSSVLFNYQARTRMHSSVHRLKKLLALNDKHIKEDMPSYSASQFKHNTSNMSKSESSSSDKILSSPAHDIMNFSSNNERTDVDKNADNSLNEVSPYPKTTASISSTNDRGIIALHDQNEQYVGKNYNITRNNTVEDVTETPTRYIEDDMRIYTTRHVNDTLNEITPLPEYRKENTSFFANTKYFLKTSAPSLPMSFKRNDNEKPFLETSTEVTIKSIDKYRKFTSIDVINNYVLPSELHAHQSVTNSETSPNKSAPVKENKPDTTEGTELEEEMYYTSGERPLLSHNLSFDANLVRSQIEEPFNYGLTTTRSTDYTESNAITVHMEETDLGDVGVISNSLSTSAQTNVANMSKPDVDSINVTVSSHGDGNMEIKNKTYVLNSEFASHYKKNELIKVKLRSTPAFPHTESSLSELRKGTNKVNVNDFSKNITNRTETPSSNLYVSKSENNAFALSDSPAQELHTNTSQSEIAKQSVKVGKVFPPGHNKTIAEPHFEIQNGTDNIESSDDNLSNLKLHADSDSTEVVIQSIKVDRTNNSNSFSGTKTTHFNKTHNLTHIVKDSIPENEEFTTTTLHSILHTNLSSTGTYEFITYVTKFYEYITSKSIDERTTEMPSFSVMGILDTNLTTDETTRGNNISSEGITLYESYNNTEINSADSTLARNDSSSDGVPGWPVKLAAEVTGDLILGGLMMVHEREDSVTCGPIMPQGGIQALETMLYTLDMLNREPKMIPNVTIGVHILDDCDKDTYGLEMAVDFIKGRIKLNVFFIHLSFKTGNIDYHQYLKL